MQEEIVYLGFLILANGLTMDLEKVKEILEWPTPKNFGEVRSFHDLASFDKKFIMNLSFFCNAMTEIMRGDKKDFKWTHEAHNGFQTLKKIAKP